MGTRLVKKPWFELHPEILETIKKDIRSRYSDLRFVYQQGIAYLRGSFPVVHKEQELARYQIEVIFPNNYPQSLPLVREIEGKIPVTADRHVYDNGVSCLFVPEEWLVDLGRQPSFIEFIEGPVRNYFIGQALVAAGKPWPFGQHSHGSKGLIEAYGKWFNTQDKATIIRYLFCLSKKEVRGHWLCPCGSKKIIRKCHVAEIRRLQNRIYPALAKQALDRFRKTLETEDAKKE